MNRKLTTIAGITALGLAGLALVGAGAHATFTTNTTSTQKITSGTLTVAISNPHSAGCTTASNNCTTLALPDYGPASSSFDSGLQTITITNTGDVPANEITVKLTDVNTSAALHDQLWICTISSGVVYQNEKLSAMEAGGLMSITGTLAPGATDSYTEEFYAGDAANSCGALAQGSPAPASATNPAAASLDNAAQGGTVTPSYTVGYSG